MRFFFLLVLVVFVLPFSVFAQVPVIYSIDKTHAAANEIITINGDHFGTTPANLKVFFGPVLGEVISVQEVAIKVKVPAGATFDNVSVTDVATSLTAYSPEPFFPSFGGKTLNATNFSEKRDFPEEDELYDICNCDFDGDGLNDAVVTNNSEKSKFTSVTVFKNNSKPEEISFSRLFGSELNINRETRNVTCGDLDGDGKADLIVSQGGNAAENIYTFKNVSTDPNVIKFKKGDVLSLADGGATNGARRLKILDMDGDGRPEIIVSNQTVNNVVIFGNESTKGSIKFPNNRITRLVVPSTNLGLAVKDLNGDGLPEVIVNNNLAENIYYLENKSSTGYISFAPPTTINVPGSLINLVAGDLDGDNKTDLAVVKFTTGNISVLLNQSEGKKIAFSSPQNFIVSQNPWGIDMGDLNGDGLLDMAIASLSDKEKIVLMINNSSPGKLNFQSLKVGENEVNRNIKIVDLNGDAKPDLCYTSQNSLGAFQITTLRNSGCVFPQITPAVPDAICDGNPIELNATPALYVNYQWKKNGSDLTGETNATLTTNSGGDYAVVVTSEIEKCTESSPTVNVVESNDAIPEIPTIRNKGVFCEGESIEMEPASIINGAIYFWSGPNGFTQTGAKLKINNAQLKMAGEYFLDIKTSACQSVRASSSVSIASLPSVNFSESETVTICTGSTYELIAGNGSNLTFQWYKNGAALSGENQYKLTVSETGNYSIKITNSAGCSTESSAKKVEVLPLPTAKFSITKSDFCIGEEVVFTNQSTGASGHELSYKWDFGDGKAGSDKTPKHIYDKTGSFTVNLSTQYANYNCGQQFSKSLNVTPLPTFEIISSSGKTCKGDTVELSLSDSFQEVLWSTGSTKKTLAVYQEGTYEAVATNSYGCSSRMSKDIYFESPPQVSIEAERTLIELGESVQLTASGANAYSWSPAETLSDDKIYNPIASPQNATIYSVLGTDALGCTNTSEIEILVNRELNIFPKNAFSPNNDGIDDLWVIENIEYFPDCKILIFNIQGNKVYETSAYQNDWNGTDNTGRELKKGVYYYTIRCNGNNKNDQTGSITLLK